MVERQALLMAPEAFGERGAGWGFAGAFGAGIEAGVAALDEADTEPAGGFALPRAVAVADGGQRDERGFRAGDLVGEDAAREVRGCDALASVAAGHRDARRG